MTGGVDAKPSPPSYGRRRSAGSSSNRRRSGNVAETRADDDDDGTPDGVTDSVDGSPVGVADFDDDDKMRDDDAPETKQMTDPSANKRYAAVADASYEDNRMKIYPSLKGTQFDTKLSDDRNVIYHDKKDGSVWWGVRGTDFNSLSDLSTDAGIIAQHIGESKFSNLHKIFTIPESIKKTLPIAAKVAMNNRFQKVEDKYKQIRKKYGKTNMINIGGHSLGGALSQHLLKTLTPAQETHVRVHTFNSLPLHGFDADKHKGSYHSTKNMLDPVSMHSKGPNLRVIQDVKVGDKYQPNTAHQMSQFVGRDLNKIPRGHKTSTYESLRPRNDAAERADADAIKAAHKKTREILRKRFIKGLKLKQQPVLRKQEPSDDADL